MKFVSVEWAGYAVGGWGAGMAKCGRWWTVVWWWTVLKIPVSEAKSVDRISCYLHFTYYNHLTTHTVIFVAATAAKLIGLMGLWVLWLYAFLVSRVVWLVYDYYRWCCRRTSAFVVAVNRKNDGKLVVQHLGTLLDRTAAIFFKTTLQYATLFTFCA